MGVCAEVHRLHAVFVVDASYLTIWTLSLQNIVLCVIVLNFLWMCFNCLGPLSYSIPSHCQPGAFISLFPSLVLSCICVHYLLFLRLGTLLFISLLIVEVALISLCLPPSYPSTASCHISNALARLSFLPYPLFFFHSIKLLKVLLSLHSVLSSPIIASNRTACN